MKNPFAPDAPPHIRKTAENIAVVVAIIAMLAGMATIFILTTLFPNAMLVC